MGVVGLLLLSLLLRHVCWLGNVLSFRFKNPPGKLAANLMTHLGLALSGCSRAWGNGVIRQTSAPLLFDSAGSL